MIFNRNKLTEKQYYEFMCEIDKFVDLNNIENSFDELHEVWYKCFTYILKSFKKGFNKKSISALYFDYNMFNWDLMYKDIKNITTKREYIINFINECSYISDRANFDRLFRAHWYFIKVYSDKLDKLKR